MVTTRVRLVVLALVVAAAGVGLPAVAAQPGPSSTTTTASNASANDVAPGAQLAGAIGAQGATVDGTLEYRAFDHALATVQSNASKAALVASRQAALSERVQSLADQRADLVAAHRKGTLSDGAFAARMASLAARGQSTSALAERVAATAEALPAAERTSHGVDVQALRETGARARSLANVTGLPAAAAVVDGGPPGVAAPPTSPIATLANATGANATSADVAVGTDAVDSMTADADGNATATRSVGDDASPTTTVSVGDALNETVNATRDGVLDAAQNTTDGADANETV